MADQREGAMRTPKEKYLNDADYHALVTMLEGFIHRAQFTPSELREAAVYACIRYESGRVKPMFIPFAKEPDNG